MRTSRLLGAFAASVDRSKCLSTFNSLGILCSNEYVIFDKINFMFTIITKERALALGIAIFSFIMQVSMFLNVLRNGTPSMMFQIQHFCSYKSIHFITLRNYQSNRFLIMRKIWHLRCLCVYTVWREIFAFILFSPLLPAGKFKTRPYCLK